MTTSIGGRMAKVASTRMNAGAPAHGIALLHPLTHKRKVEHLLEVAIEMVNRNQLL